MTRMVTSRGWIVTSLHGANVRWIGPAFHLSRVRRCCHCDPQAWRGCVSGDAVAGTFGPGTPPRRFRPVVTSRPCGCLNDHRPWSSLVSPPLLACHLDDGCVTTKSKLLVTSSVYAAGSVVRCPDARTGRREAQPLRARGGDGRCEHGRSGSPEGLPAHCVGSKRPRGRNIADWRRCCCCR